MDVSITNGLEGVRQYFQGLPTTSNSSTTPTNSLHTSELSTTYSTRETKDRNGLANDVWHLPKTSISDTKTEQNKSIETNYNQPATNTTIKQQQLSYNEANLLNSNQQIIVNGHGTQEKSEANTVPLPKLDMRAHIHDLWKASYKEKNIEVNSDNDKSSKNETNRVLSNVDYNETKIKEILPHSSNKSDITNIKTEHSFSNDDAKFKSNEVEVSEEKENKVLLASEAKNISQVSITEENNDRSKENVCVRDEKQIILNNKDSLSPLEQTEKKSPDTLLQSSQEMRPVSIESKTVHNEIKQDDGTKSLSTGSNLPMIENKAFAEKETIKSLTSLNDSKITLPLTYESRTPSQDNFSSNNINSFTYEIKACEMKPQLHEIRSPSHEVRPPSHEMRPPSHEMRPPSHEMRPPSHEMRPPSHEMRPPSHEMRPPSHEMRPPSRETRPPSHEMRPPSHEMRPPSHEMRPPSHEMRPPSHEMRPLSHEMRPPSHEIRLASHEMRPPSHEMRSPLHEIRPPSNEMRPVSSHEIRLTSQEVRPSSHEMKYPFQEIRTKSYEMQSPIENKPSVCDVKISLHEMKTSHNDIRQLPPSEAQTLSHEIKVNSLEMRTHEARLSSQEMRISSHESRPSSNEIRTPTYENRSVFHEMRPTSHDMRPSSHEMRPPPHEMRLSSHEIRPPSHEMRPTSREVRPPPSHEMRTVFHETQIRPLAQEIRQTANVPMKSSSTLDNHLSSQELKSVSQNYIMQTNSHIPQFDTRSSSHNLTHSMEMRHSLSENKWHPYENNVSANDKILDVKFSQDVKPVTSDVRPSREIQSALQDRKQFTCEIRNPSQEYRNYLQGRNLSGNDTKSVDPNNYKLNSYYQQNMVKTESDLQPHEVYKTNDINSRVEQEKIAYYDTRPHSNEIRSYLYQNKNVNNPITSFQNTISKVDQTGNDQYQLNTNTKNPHNQSNIHIAKASQEKQTSYERAPSVEITGVTYPDKQPENNTFYNKEPSVSFPQAPNSQYIYKQNKISFSQDAQNRRPQDVILQSSYHSSVPSSRAITNTNVSLPHHDMQASFNDIRPTFSQIKNSKIANEVNQSYHQSQSIRYDTMLNAQKELRNSQPEIKSREQFQQQRTPYYSISQPSYTQSIAHPTYSMTTATTQSGGTERHQITTYSTSDKRNTSSFNQEYQQHIAAKMSQSITEKHMYPARSYYNSTAVTSVNSQTYNTQNQMANQYPSRTVIQDAEQLEKQRIVNSAFQRSVQKTNLTTSQANYENPRIEHSRSNVSAYMQNYDQSRLPLVQNHSTPLVNYQSQSQVPPQPNPNTAAVASNQSYQNPNYPNFRNYYPTSNAEPIRSQSSSTSNTLASQYLRPSSTQIPSAKQYSTQQFVASVKSAQYPQQTNNSQYLPQSIQNVTNNHLYQQNQMIAQNQGSQKETSNYPTSAVPYSNTSYPPQKSNKETSSKMPSHRQKQANQTSSGYNTPHLAFKTSSSLTQNVYKYPVQTVPNIVSQYNSYNKNSTYLTTTAQMSNYTTVSVNSFQSSNTTTTNYATGNSPNISSQIKPALQEALIKRQQLNAPIKETDNLTQPGSSKKSDSGTTIIQLNKIKRESPLDLSVKTIRTSADSTAGDDVQVIDNRNSQNISNYPSSISSHPQNLPYHQPRFRYTTPASGAPRVDFSPNFNTTQLTQPPLRFSVSNQPPVLTQTRIHEVPPNQVYSQEYNKHLSTNAAAIVNKSYDGKTGYYPNYHLPNTGQYIPNTEVVNNSTTNNNIPRQDLVTQQKPIANAYSPVKDNNRKRPNDTFSSSYPAKVPRVDNWRQSIDQQIEQRFLSYTNSKIQEQKQITTTVTESSKVNGYPPIKSENSVIKDQPEYSPHLYSHTSIRPPYPESQNISKYQQYIPQQNQLRPSQPELVRSDSYQKLNQAGTINQTNVINSGVDKRVISILRNSLEIKGAKEAQKRIEHEQNLKANEIHSQPIHNTNELSPQTLAKNNLILPNLSSHPNVSSVEYNTATMLTKFHLPRAVDSIKYENQVSKNNSNILENTEKENASIAEENAKISTNNSNSSPADLDGLAANLAARIRTKAELKQVDPSQFNKTDIAENVEPEASTISTNDSEQSTPVNNNNNNCSNIPKLTKEKLTVYPPRRRLFSRTDEEGNSTVPHRNSTLRSSSETSVFDFRDSDSEGEMSVRERQSLDDLRRDRKSLSKPPSTSNLTIDTDVVIKSEPIESPDPFFTETCDKFMEQLRSGNSNKKRGRKKKVVEPEIIAKLETTMKKQQLVEVEIKVEKCDDILIKNEIIAPIVPPTIDDVEVKVKVEQVDKEDDSDSDVPLIGIKKKNMAVCKKIESESDDDDDVELAVLKKREPKGAKIKLESSSDSESDPEEKSDRECLESVAARLRQRKCRSSEKRSNLENTLNNQTKECTPQKTRSKSAPQKKPSFGDGSDFRPGWEEEVYRYKQSLRMPAQLINISRPSRISTSLPDLDPCPSPTTSSFTDSEFFNQRRSVMKNLFGSNKVKREFDSDLDSNSSFSMIQDKNIDDSEEATCSSILSSTSKNQKDNNNSIIDVLAQRYGKNKQKKTKKDSGPKIIPKSSNPIELLPTPGLDIENNENKVIVTKSSKRLKNKRLQQEKQLANENASNSNLLGFFRKKTVNNFRDAFRRNNIHEQFTPIVFKSRTRKETQVLKKRATIREVFGEERPASAPPMTNHQEVEISQPAKVSIEKASSTSKKKKPVVNKVVTKTRKETALPMRTGLRSAIVLRGNRSIIKTRRQLAKSKQLMKTFNTKRLRSDVKLGKFSSVISKNEKDKRKIIKETKQSVKESQRLKNKKNDVSRRKESNESIKSAEKLDIKVEIKQEEEVGNENKLKLLPRKKKYKLKSMRRKFSSGFDYIRKKKKQVKKENAESEMKPKKRNVIQRACAESVQDIQREIKGWVLNKGIGETYLHRASRLGYTDVIAYCLETLGSNPSPKDNAGYTPLYEACSRGHLDIAKLLLLYGANVHESAQGGTRPLHEAAENGFVEIIRLLLSYGADPSLATYAGVTPISLANDSDTKDILQNYLADIQGREAPHWTFHGPAPCFDSQEQGYDTLEEAPSPDPIIAGDDIEMEISDFPLPNLYTLRAENPADKWVLLQDLSNTLKIKSRDALLRQINPPQILSSSANSQQLPPPANHKNILKEMKMADFLEQAHCCSLLSAGERVNIRASKIALVKYTDRVRELLGVEKCVLPPVR